MNVHRVGRRGVGMPLSGPKSDRSSAGVPDRRTAGFGVLGTAVCGGAFGRGDSGIQLLLSAAPLYVYDQRSAELDRAGCLPANRVGGRQSVGARSQRGRTVEAETTRS